MQAVSPVATNSIPVAAVDGDAVVEIEIATAAEGAVAEAGEDEGMASDRSSVATSTSLFSSPSTTRVGHQANTS